MRSILFVIFASLFIAGCNPCPVEFDSDFIETAESNGYVMTLEVEDSSIPDVGYSAEDLILILESVLEAGRELGLPNMDNVENKMRVGHVLVTSSVETYNGFYHYPRLYIEGESGNAMEFSAGFIIPEYAGLDCSIHSNARYIVVVNAEYASDPGLIIHEFSHRISEYSFGTSDHGHSNELIWGNMPTQLRGLAREIFDSKLADGF